MFEWWRIDVNDNLEEIISVSDDDNCMEFLYDEIGSITNLMISDNLCNEYPISMIDFSRYDKLYNIEIGDGNFDYVSEFRIDGLNDLKSLIIGKNSFRMNDGNDDFRSFHVMNCDELESIEIGMNSFVDYNEFELKNLHSLCVIKLDSYSFYSSSFVIRGRFDLWWIWIDLPCLELIDLGEYTLYGDYDKYNSLIMESIDDWIDNIIDLPNLSNISSIGRSLFWIRDVYLYSIIYIIHYEIDIPNIEEVNLPYSLRYVYSSYIYSNSFFIIIILDIHYSFYSIIQNITIPSIPPYYSTCSYLNNLKEYSISLSIPNNVCNSNLLTAFDLSAFVLLQSISIGNDNFMYVNEFLINNLMDLKSLVIGSNSFSMDYGDHSFRSFRILNCDKLESIEIGSYSFSDYGDEFELRNLPSLVSIDIDVNCFCGSSFEIRGIIDMILRMNRST